MDPIGFLGKYCWKCVNPVCYIFPNLGENVCVFFQNNKNSHILNVLKSVFNIKKETNISKLVSLSKNLTQMDFRQILLKSCIPGLLYFSKFGKKCLGLFTKQKCTHFWMFWNQFLKKKTVPKSLVWANSRLLNNQNFVFVSLLQNLPATKVFFCHLDVMWLNDKTVGNVYLYNPGVIRLSLLMC